ncbi:zinc-binding dehydrogenase [Streptomyces sp. NPDC050997]|uniref:zinc-binding dehydrogenase n=1 Tax=Streptomyces sp. NPDC050997 TaxID=3155519 RepID=UPI003425DF3A
MHGAAGGVGSMAVQIAVARGATVLGAYAADRAEFLRGLDATPVGDDEQVTERVRTIVPGGIDAVFDTVGRGMLARATAAGHDVTRYASTVDITDPRTRPVFARLVPADLHAVTELAARGHLLPHVGAVLPLSEAADAHRLAATRHGKGRIVLRIGA